MKYLLLRAALSLAVALMLTALYPTLRDANFSDASFGVFAFVIGIPILLMASWLLEARFRP